MGECQSRGCRPCTFKHKFCCSSESLPDAWHPHGLRNPHIQASSSVPKTELLPLPRTDQRLAEEHLLRPSQFWAWTGWLRLYRPAKVGGGQAVERCSGRDTDPAHSSVMSAGAGREGVGCFSGELEPSKTKHSAVPQAPWSYCPVSCCGNWCFFRVSVRVWDWAWGSEWMSCLC